MGRIVLGELEHLILATIVRLGDNAYGAAIIDEIERCTGAEVSQAGAYVAMQRLERKGLIEGREGEPTEQRGGRPKRYFDLTPVGVGRLRDSARALFGVWDGIEGLLDGDSEA